MGDAAAREPGTVGKPAAMLRGNGGVSVAHAPALHGNPTASVPTVGDSRAKEHGWRRTPVLNYRRPRFLAQRPTELPTLPDSHAAPPSGAHGKKGYLKSSLLVHARMSTARSLAQNSSRAARSDTARALVILRRGMPATSRTLAMRSSM